jgi:hypothetical protein
LYQVPTIILSETGAYDFTGIQAANIFGGLNPSQGPVVTIDVGDIGHDADNCVRERRNEACRASSVQWRNNWWELGLRVDAG